MLTTVLLHQYKSPDELVLSNLIHNEGTLLAKKVFNYDCARKSHSHAALIVFVCVCGSKPHVHNY